MNNPLSEAHSASDEAADARRIEAFIDCLIAGALTTRPVQSLDVNCGPGRLFNVFRARGWEVTSMQPDPDFFDAAAAAG